MTKPNVVDFINEDRSSKKSDFVSQAGTIAAIATTLSTDRLWAYLKLMRSANIVTAWADILAGCAVFGFNVGNLH